MASKIICTGYGGWHGFAVGRHWFACSKCRWAPNYSDAKHDALVAEKKRQDDAYKALHKSSTGGV